MDNIIELIKTARGLSRADLFVKNCKIINVYSGEIVSSSFAVKNGLIVGFGEYEAEEVIDLRGRWVCPGLIDGHVHIESSMLTPEEYAKVVLPKGTTTVISDPHEIANVSGLAGIDYMLKASENLPLNVFVMLPSCVPATNMETSGAILTAEDLKQFIEHPRVLGLAELMNFPGVLNFDTDILKKIQLAKKKRIDGHAPGLEGRDLSAYVLAGVGTDHECTTPKEALLKLRLGMRIMIRQGSAAQNLDDLLPFITSANSRRCIFVSDDRHPKDLIQQGHIDYMIRRAIKKGIEPVTAIQMATLNTAEWFGLTDLGAIAPGFRADFVVLDDLENFEVNEVYHGGTKAAEHGTTLFSVTQCSDKRVLGTMHVGQLDKRTMHQKLALPASGPEAYAIKIIPHQIVTEKTIVRPPLSDNCFMPDKNQDLAKIAVVERHKASGRVGTALVQGFGLKKGAIASSVTHDSHNIIVVGMNDADMITATEAVLANNGGIVVVNDGTVLGVLPLPVAGLMSLMDAGGVNRILQKMHEEAGNLGVHDYLDPFMTLSFLALPVIPTLKLTDLGLVDIERWEIIPVNVNGSKFIPNE